MMLCRKVIADKQEPRRETYCMRELGHTGKCSIHPTTCYCYICKPTAEFSTIKSLEDHVKKIHRMWKG